MNELVDRRFELEAVYNIPDMTDYAQQWERLAADFRSAGMVSNSELCDSKAKHYYDMANGEYVRLQQTGYVELIPVQLEAYAEPTQPVTQIVTPHKIVIYHDG